MEPKQLILRCYGKRVGNQWVAVCVDLCLAAQGSSSEEARRKLFVQIDEYVHDALIGDDSEHAEYLLTRKAPPGQLLTYNWIKFMHRIHAIKDSAYTLFSETMPMQPKY